MQIATSMVRVAAVIGLLLVGTGAAAYEIRRSEFSDNAGTAPVYAEVESQSFDDAVGVLFDGVTYFYLAGVTGESPVTLMVSKLESLATVRLEFSQELSGREQAAFTLGSMADVAGTFDQMIEGLEPENDPGAEKVAQALELVLQALSILQSGDVDNDKDALSNFLKGAVGNLQSALDDPGMVDPDEISAALEMLLEISRLVAVHHLEAAWATCGECSDGDPGKVCDAEEALQAADDERLESEPDLEQAVGDYATTVDKSLDALSSCN